MQRVDASQRALRFLVKAVNELVASERTRGEAGRKEATLLNNVAVHEHSPKLKEVLQSIGHEMQRLEEDRKKWLWDRLERTISAKLGTYTQDTFQPCRQIEKDMTAALQDLAKKKEQFESENLKKPVNQLKVTKAKQEMLDSLTRAQNTEMLFMETAVRMERQRVQDMKSVLEEYINSQIFMHCRAVEKLSVIAQKVAAVSPDEEARAMHDVLESATSGRVAAGGMPAGIQMPAVSRARLPLQFLSRAAKSLHSPAVGGAGAPRAGSAPPGGLSSTEPQARASLGARRGADSDDDDEFDGRGGGGVGVGLRAGDRGAGDRGSSDLGGGRPPSRGPPPPSSSRRVDRDYYSDEDDDLDARGDPRGGPSFRK